MDDREFRRPTLAERYVERYERELPEACGTCDPFYRGMDRGFRRSIEEGDIEAAYRLGTEMKRFLRR